MQIVMLLMYNFKFTLGLYHIVFLIIFSPSKLPKVGKKAKKKSRHLNLSKVKSRWSNPKLNHSCFILKIA